jgi:DNA-binding NtrC family response regulator
VRIVAATHRDLRRDVNAGRFRADLYFRLAVVEAVLPPLRERAEDIPTLAGHFFRETVERTKVPAPPLTPEELGKLAAHYWPGNVRELRNAIERRVLVGAELDLQEALHEEPTAGPGFEASLLPFREAKARVTEQFEREYLKAILERSQGNVSQASREAKMDRSYLVELIRKHGLGAKEG